MCVEEKFRAAKQASIVPGGLGCEVKDSALAQIAFQLNGKAGEIIEANSRDLTAARRRIRIKFWMR